MTGATMKQSNPATERIVEPMIALARCSKRERILVAGSNSAEVMSALHRCGYARVTTTASCGLPAGQHDVALVDARQRSVKVLETTLDWLVEFVAPNGVLVIWVDAQERAGNKGLRSAIESHGFLIEAGTMHDDGSAVSARRCEKAPSPGRTVLFER